MADFVTNDVFLVLGVVVLVLAIPSLLGSIFDHRPPRATAILVLIGGGLVALAVWREPGGYAIEDIPHAFTRVIALITR